MLQIQQENLLSLECSVEDFLRRRFSAIRGAHSTDHNRKDGASATPDTAAWCAS
jgi:hypothetical protein